jgi:hypothetical protein
VAPEFCFVQVSPQCVVKYFAWHRVKTAFVLPNCFAILTGSLWRRRAQQSFNTSTPFYFPSLSLHVSAPTGHLQVRYTIGYFNGQFLIQFFRQQGWTDVTSECYLLFFPFCKYSHFS